MGNKIEKPKPSIVGRVGRNKDNAYFFTAWQGGGGGYHTCICTDIFTHKLKTKILWHQYLCRCIL